ncbi:MAG: fructuronate reductase, partial [Pseudonocardiales bacterium]|nr:fructuronate reductase [Pseudonocardiales bacterium]
MLIHPEVADALAAGRSVERLAVPIAAWMHFVRRRTAEGAPIVDPLADQLADTARLCSGEAPADVARFL